MIKKLSWIEGYLHSQSSPRTAIIEYEINIIVDDFQRLDFQTCMRIKSVMYLIPEFILKLSEHPKLERLFNEILKDIDDAEIFRLSSY